MLLEAERKTKDEMDAIPAGSLIQQGQDTAAAHDQAWEMGQEKYILSGRER